MSDDSGRVSIDQDKVRLAREIQKEMRIAGRCKTGLAEYHVGCGQISGEIFAGTLSKDGSRWLNRSVVTDEAINAVRDRFMEMAGRDMQNTYGLRRTRKDGGKATLMLKIEGGSKDDN